MSVLDANGVRVDNGDSHLATDDASSLIVTLQALPKGTYTVAWQVVSSDDAHATQGEFAFAVGVGNPTAAYTGLVEQVERSARALQLPPLLETVLRWWVLLALALVCGGFAFTPLVARSASLADYRQLSA